MSDHRDPAETFIGMSIDTDPFKLLGLPRAPADEAQVLAALGAKMSEIAEHQRSRTPEANELRLALHAAAAQLLDPQLQELLLVDDLQEEPSGPLQQTPTPVQNENPTPHDPPIPSPAIESNHLSHDLLLVVAANGGWNQSAMRRLALLAHARGVPSSQLPSIVADVLTSPQHKPRPQGDVAVATDAPDSPQSMPASGARTGSIQATSVSSKRKSKMGSWIVTGLFAILTIGSLLLVWSRLTSESDEPKPVDDTTTAQQTPAQSRRTPSTDVSDGPEPQRTISVNDAARQITALGAARSKLSETDRAELRSALSVVADNWTDMAGDQIVAIHNALIELLYTHAEASSVSLEIIEWISDHGTRSPRTSDDLKRSTWAIGTLSRLSIERNFSTTVDSAIVGRLASLLGDGVRTGVSGFTEGIRVALANYDGQLAREQVPVSAWQTWMSILDTIDTEGSASHTAAVLDAIETLATEAAEPNSSRNVYEAMESLTSTLTLAKSNEVSRRLVAWHGDERVSSADLSVIMRTLIASSAIPGVDEHLVLSAGADTNQRMSVRTELEELLLGVNSGSSEALKQWVGVADLELARPMGTTTIELLVRATARSRLSAAGRATFWGDYQAAETLLSNLTDDLDRLAASAQDDAQSYLGGDGALGWAERYLSARQNIPIRQALLAELTRGRQTLGPVAAEALVRDAFFGSPAAIRAQAREVVMLHAQSPAVTNAVLELLPRIPKIDQSSEIIDTITHGYLPAASDPQWSYLARQQLVETLLRQISGVGEGYAVDQFVSGLSESYQKRLGRQQSGSMAAQAIDLRDLAHELYMRWERSAEEHASDIEVARRLEELRMRRIGRITLADGIIAEFAAEQVSLVEAMAIVIESERPEAASAIAEIIEEMSDSRRGATNIIEQIGIVEAAAAKLWRLRLGGGA